MSTLGPLLSSLTTAHRFPKFSSPGAIGHRGQHGRQWSWERGWRWGIRVLVGVNQGTVTDSSPLLWRGDPNPTQVSLKLHSPDCLIHRA